MKRFSEHFRKQGTNIKLSRDERFALRERLMVYMEYHPLAQSNIAKISPTLETDSYTVVRLDLLLLGRFVGALAVLVMLVVPVIAENAVPGDVLYPIKVRINEEVRGSLTFSPYQKVEWETERLERRIAEAKLLADAGRLTPEVEQEVAIAVKTHTEAAKQEINTLRAENSEEATYAQIALNSALTVQSEALREDVSTTLAMDVASTSSVSILATAVDEAILGINDVPPDIVPTPESLLAHIEAETTLAYEYLNSIEDIASADEQRDIRRRLADVNEKITAAQMKFNPDVDIPELLTALSDVRKLISFMTSIDVRASVTVEELVPVVLTVEEQQQAVATLASEIKVLRTDVYGRLEFIPAEIKEKVDLSLVTVTELQSRASSSIETQNYEAAHVTYKEIVAILTDIELQTRDYATSVADTSETVEVLDTNVSTSTSQATTTITATTTESII